MNQRLGSPVVAALLVACLTAKRMVVGHTVQEAGISSACAGRAWRVDVGMSAHYGGEVAILELSNGEVRVLEPID